MSSPRLKSSYHALISDGRGLHHARLQRVSAEDHIKECLRALLLMRPGERRLSPDLGCGLADYLFRPLTEGLKRDIATQISESLAKQEKRIQLIHCTVEADSQEKSRLLVLLEYRILQSQRIDNLRVMIAP